MIFFRGTHNFILEIKHRGDVNKNIDHFFNHTCRVCWHSLGDFKGKIYFILLEKNYISVFAINRVL